LILVLATVPTPVLATTGAVTSDSPEVGTPESEITVSFQVSNTDVETAAYFLDLSLPEGWSIVDHNEPEDVTWSASKSEWFFEEVSPDQSLSSNVTVAIPADATQTGRIESVLRSRTGVQQRTTDTIEIYQEQDQVRVANARLSPATITDESKNHTLTFDAFSMSADGDSDTVAITLPNDVRIEKIYGVNITNQPYEATSIEQEDHSITVEVDPDGSKTSIDMSFNIKTRLSSTSENN